LQVLNRVIEHSGLEGVPPFTEAMLEGAAGFVSMQRVRGDGVLATARVVRQLFRKPEQDLVTLVNAYWPERNFSGLQQEIR
jgi:hypothetical protein